MELTYIKGSITDPNSREIDFQTQYEDATNWALDIAQDELCEVLIDYIPHYVLDDEMMGYIEDRLVELAEANRSKINVRLRKAWHEWECLENLGER